MRLAGNQCPFWGQTIPIPLVLYYRILPVWNVRSEAPPMDLVLRASRQSVHESHRDRRTTLVHSCCVLACERVKCGRGPRMVWSGPTPCNDAQRRGRRILPPYRLYTRIRIPYIASSVPGYRTSYFLLLERFSRNPTRRSTAGAATRVLRYVYTVRYSCT